MLHIELTRVDYNLIGLTNKKCMKLLPTSNSTQKIAIGDQDGVVHIFGMKKGECNVVFKSNSGPAVGCVELGGVVGQTRDKIFTACGNEVKGFTKKGKQFLGFNTNLMHNITSIFVVGTDLIVCGANNLYHYQDCKEVNNYLCGDAINDVVAYENQINQKIVIIIACEDKSIRILESGYPIKTIALTSMPTILHIMDDDSLILYGTLDGTIGFLDLKRQDFKNGIICETGEGGSEITAISCYDLIGNGIPQLILGRDDGTIQIRSFSIDGNESKIIYSHCFNESITAIQGGIVGSFGFEEIVVATFSGWVFGLTTEVVDKSVAISTDAQHVRLSEEAQNKIIRLRTEIDELEEQIQKEREKYQALSVDNEDAMSAIPLIAINDKMYLNKDDASYSLLIEVQTSIDNVLIQSDVPIDLLDVHKNSAVVSFSDCDSRDGNFLLATYRCQLNTTRLELKLRTIEGQYGIVRAYVTPNMQPKCCQIREYRVKPLSLQTRIHEIDQNRPYNILKLNGTFSLAEMHSWIEQCLPEMPAKPPNESATFYFLSTFVGTMLQISYSKGEAEFKSDNISTISILKDVLSKEATRSNKKRNIDITWEINDSSISHSLSLIHPKLTHQLELERLATIIEAMGQVDLDGGGLTDEYTKILAKEKEIMAEFQQQPAFLDRLYGMITDLYIDVYKFQGVQVKNRIPALLELLSAERSSRLVGCCYVRNMYLAFYFLLSQPSFLPLAFLCTTHHDVDFKNELFVEILED